MKAVLRSVRNPWLIVRDDWASCFAERVAERAGGIDSNCFVLTFCVSRAKSVDLRVDRDC
jgi:hypothetical protein